MRALGTRTALQRAMIAGTLSLMIFVMGGSHADAQSRGFVCRNPDNKIGGWGSWETGCDADTYGDVARIRYIYSDYVFNRNIEDPAHRDEYVTNIVVLIRKLAKEYYQARHPLVSNQEVEGFAHAMVTVAAVESWFSHYRISFDGRYKIMTGDQTVSHGLMQINQMFHANRELDSSFDLVGNIAAALDTYHNEWERSLNSSCFKAAVGANPTLEKTLEVRARSAYGAYNGGASRLCRFTKPRDTYAEHDRNFIRVYLTKPYMKHVVEPGRRPKLNVACLLEQNDLCAVAPELRKEFLKARSNTKVN